MVLSEYTYDPVYDDEHGRNPQRMSMKRLKQFPSEEPGDRMAESTPGTPIDPQVMQRTKTIARIHRTGKSQGSNGSDPDKRFQVPSDK